MSIPQKPYNFQLDLYQPTPIPQMIFHQTDSGTSVIDVTLKKSRVPVDLTGLTVNLAVFKSDNTITIYTSIVNIADAKNGMVSITLSRQAISAIGYAHAQIILISDSNEETVFPEFTFRVKKSYDSDGVLASINEFPIFSSCVNIVKNFVHLGDYDSLTEYKSFNMVKYGLATYMCVSSCIGILPTTIVNWKLISKDGKNGFSSIIESTFTAIIDETSYIPTGFTDYYGSEFDDLQVFDGYTGSPLIKDVNYIENTDNISIQLTDWTIDIGDSILFKLYKNLHEDTIQETIDKAILQHTQLQSDIEESKSTEFAEEILDSRQGHLSLLTNLEDKDIKIDIKLADILTLNTSVVSEINAIISDSIVNNQKIKFKKKIYEIDSSIILPSDVFIDFNRAVIKRKTGSGVFDLIRNDDLINGNDNIVLENLRIDGNKDADSMTANGQNSFSGLKLKYVTNSKLSNVEVIGTISAEDGNAGVYMGYCELIECFNLNGNNNDRTSILLDYCKKITIDGSLTYDNLGSGISGVAEESHFNNIITFNNGYSNLSVNGVRCSVNNVITFGSKFSGLNIGHATLPADDTTISNVKSYNNVYDGLTISGSNRVQVTNFVAYGNLLNNIEIKENSNNSKLLNITSRNSAGGQGILYASGIGHLVDMSDIFENVASGIYVSPSCSVTVGANVQIYNNGQVSVGSSGIVLAQSLNCKILMPKCFDNQTIKTQDVGILVAGGDGHTIVFPEDVKNNISYQIRLLSSPTNIVVKYLDVKTENIFTSLAGTRLNGWVGSANAGYWKDVSGFVHLIGSFSSGTLSTIAFNLPINYRIATSSNWATLANNLFAMCGVGSTGDVTLFTSNINHYVNNVVFKSV